MLLNPLPPPPPPQKKSFLLDFDSAARVWVLIIGAQDTPLKQSFLSSL